MENLFTFEYPPAGLIRVIVMKSEPCRLYLAVEDIAAFMPGLHPDSLKGYLFHNDLALRT